VSVGAVRARLEGLLKYRGEHKEAINFLERNMSQGTGSTVLDQAGVEQLVQTLYSLKHYGHELQRIRETIEEAHEIAYREKPYYMRAKPDWTEPEDDEYEEVSGDASSKPSAGTSTFSKIKSSAVTVVKGLFNILPSPILREELCVS
jgi:hypothetical protein